jgi:hypothetical protein
MPTSYIFLVEIIGDQVGHAPGELLLSLGFLLYTFASDAFAGWFPPEQPFTCLIAHNVYYVKYSV